MVICGGVVVPDYLSYIGLLFHVLTTTTAQRLESLLGLHLRGELLAEDRQATCARDLQNRDLDAQLYSNTIPELDGGW